MRFIPFVDTLQSALDKVRGALSASDQRELLAHAQTLTFTGVPTLPVSSEVRKVIEESWFTGRLAKITYVDRQYKETERVITVRGILMERSATHIIAHELDKAEGRRLRLDRIKRAELASISAPPPARR
jgi:predicted DNA-binding transcriptional regulator YafY